MALKNIGSNVLLILILVNLMALGELFHALMMMNWQPGTTVMQLFLAQLASAACFGVLIPLIARFAGRYPLARERWGKNILPLLLGGALVCAIQPFLYTGLDRMIGAVLGPLYSFHYRYRYAFVPGIPTVPFWRVWWYVLTYYLTSLVFFYACVVALVSARQNYQLLRRSELERMQLEAGLTTARFHILTAQLQPHFLFNTLNSISELMYEDVASAERMVARLGELLRLTLAQQDSALVSLNRELEGLTIYLEIEKIRFQDRLTVETKIAPATRECLVPFMILQPLAENAVRHGISRITRPGRILIESTLQKGFLEFEILNDGPIQAAQPSEGLGLRNSRDRLQALYRDNYTLEYGPLPEGGWRVHLRIPESRSAMPDAYNQIAKANGY